MESGAHSGAIRALYNEGKKYTEKKQKNEPKKTVSDQGAAPQLVAEMIAPLPLARNAISTQPASAGDFA